MNGDGRTHHADGWEPLRREIARARRFGRDFALVRVPRRLERALAAATRDIDEVWCSGNATYVLLPEAGAEAARALVARVRRSTPDLLPDHGVTVAAFPADGLTSGALLETLAREAARDETAAHRVPVPAYDGSALHA